MQILADSFRVHEIDREGKLYTNVSRGYMSSSDTTIKLDYHSVLCRLEVGNTVEIRIFLGVEPDIECDYLVAGKVYQVEDIGEGRLLVKASFGGLLLMLESPKDKVGGVGDRTDISLALTLI